MPTLPTSLEVLKRLKIVYVCMKRITVYFGNIKTGGQAYQKFVGLDGLQFLSSVLWLIMSMDSSGTFIRQVESYIVCNNCPGNLVYVGALLA